MPSSSSSPSCAMKRARRSRRSFWRAQASSSCPIPRPASWRRRPPPAFTRCFGPNCRRRPPVSRVLRASPRAITFSPTGYRKRRKPSCASCLPDSRPRSSPARWRNTPGPSAARARFALSRPGPWFSRSPTTRWCAANARTHPSAIGTRRCSNGSSPSSAAATGAATEVACCAQDASACRFEMTRD